MLRLGYGPIGKGDEERGLHLSPFTFHVLAISESCGIALGFSQLARPEIVGVLEKGFN